ncbi:hypothetical protein Tco_0964802 [Tanacetum coccineum]
MSPTQPRFLTQELGYTMDSLIKDGDSTHLTGYEVLLKKVTVQVQGSKRGRLFEKKIMLLYETSLRKDA